MTTHKPKVSRKCAEYALEDPAGHFDEFAESCCSKKSMVEYVHPDVVLISLPVIDGVETSRKIKSRFPGTKAIILSVHTDRTDTGNAFQADACRVLPKDCGEEELVHTIRECSIGPSKIVGHPPHS